jgi:hypothetical protein
MKKIKYFYNTNTLRYEKMETPLRVKLLRVLSFLATTVVTALILVAVAFRYVDSPKEKILRNQYESAHERLDLLNGHVKKLEQQMTELEKRDNDVYRAIFEANPIPDSARAKAMEHQKEILLVQKMGQNDLANSISASINNIAQRMAFQDKSFT